MTQARESVGVLGTGMVGRAIATRLLGLGHDVMMGAREAASEKLAHWAGETGGRTGSFSDAAAFGAIVFNCTSGAHALSALERAGADNLAGKVLVDVANPLDFSAGMPPTLSVCNTDSLGETIQRAFPAARVVKTLCTVNAGLMVDPGQIKGDHLVYLSGEDAAAKARVKALLETFGWREIIDLGGIATARGQEMMMPLWLSLWGKLGTAQFNFALKRVDDGEDPQPT